MTSLTVLPYIFDIELSGRCNTVCSFCPRHEMKRGESFMSAENFELLFHKLKLYSKELENREVVLIQERVRAKVQSGSQSPLRVIFCGMGESLMHRQCAEWTKKIRSEIGIRVSVVTNGLLLKPKVVDALLDADITVVLVSMPGIDEESYSKYMKIDWNRVLSNIEEANAKLPGRIQINATIPDNARFSPEDVTKFWESRGIPIAGLNVCHNRGGHLSDSSLTGKHQPPASYFCGIYARHNFIAWDGRVLACCHDLHADGIVGHVANDDFLDIAMRKTPVVPQGPGYKMCTNCNDVERCHGAQIIAVPAKKIAAMAPNSISSQPPIIASPTE